MEHIQGECNSVKKEEEISVYNSVLPLELLLFLFKLSGLFLLLNC